MSVDAHCPRCLSIPGGHNIRDFGGLLLNDGSITRSGVLVRGESPSLLGTPGVNALIDYGVRTIIDLRGDEEIDAEGIGALEPHIQSGLVTYRRADMTANLNDLIQGDAIYDNLGHTYMACLNTGGTALAEALDESLWDAAQNDTSVYFHCAVGKDRTGTVAAMMLDALGAPQETITQDYLLTGALFQPIITHLRTKPSYQKSLAEVSDEALVPKREAIETFTRLLAEQGGGAGWLNMHGVDARALANWHAILTRP